MENVKTIIRAHQKSWAAANSIEIDDDGYARQISDNFFCPLDEDTHKDFKQGDGDELGRDGKRGKMAALHSSSALAVNVFMPFRQQGEVGAVSDL